MSTSNDNKASKPRIVREEFWVRVDSGDSAASFIKATDHVGRVMPFTKPRATLAMQVTPDVVAFSLLHLTKANATNVAAKPIEIPRGPLARLARRAGMYDGIGADEIVVELSTRAPRPRRPKIADPAEALGDLFAEPVGEPAADGSAEAAEASTSAPEEGGPKDASPRPAPRPATIESWRYRLSRDANSVASVEAVDDEHTFELPRGALHISVYLRSPKVDRVIAVSFIGHVGRSETTETMGRVAAMVLNSMSHLPEFRVLADIETVVVPAAPSRPAGPARQPKVTVRAGFTTQVYLFDAQLQPAGTGVVGVEFDLANANPSSGRLLTTVTPDEALADQFAPYAPVFDRALTAAIAATMTETEIAEISYDIILGSVSEGTAERLSEVGANLNAVDLSLTDHRPHA
jgi:hypothetical protein